MPDLELSPETLDAMAALRAIVSKFETEHLPLKLSLHDGAISIYSAPNGFNEILDVEVSPITAGNINLICREAQHFIDIINLPY